MAALSSKHGAHNAVKVALPQFCRSIDLPVVLVFDEIGPGG
jgi:hypothetical protein